MRHQKLRSDKNCLNCGHTVEERYCSRCGQENKIIHDSALHLVIHYFQDLFHYDGRFWHTMRNLVSKPGWVALEYIEGKRRQNIEPIKFYVFTSSIFFLLLFLVVGEISFGTEPEGENVYRQRLLHLEKEKQYLSGTTDTTLVNQLKERIYREADSIGLVRGDSTPVEARIGDVEINLFDPDEPSDTDTVQSGGFGGWIEKRMEEKVSKLEAEHEGDNVKAVTAFLDEIFHKSPQLLFLSMPFFALFLRILYVNRRNKNYVDHFIFSTYHYGYLFVLLIIYLVLTMLAKKAGVSDESSIGSLLVWSALVYVMVYLLLSLKRFYGGRWFFLILRYFLLGFLFVMIFLVLFVAIAFFTFLF